MSSVFCENKGLMIDTSGNVGIGTTNPDQLLHVYNGKIKIEYPSVPTLQLKRGGHSIANGNIEWLGNDDSVDWSIRANYDGGGSNFNIREGANSHLYIKSGNVGIGTITPSYKLDVSGIIRGNNVSPSDVRWKVNINTIEGSLEKISQLRGVTYEWTDASKGVGNQIGVIAQEVEDIFPEAVSTDDQGYKSVAYAKLVSPLIEAVKELKMENEKLKMENENIKNQLSEIMEIIKRIQ